MFKKIDKLVIKGFIGPYILSFFVAEFVLLMQFLWKQIDRILGKGISFFEIMELLFFMAVKLIPMAIPLTILISSVMVYGNMAERYELSSIKSAGISLIRAMRAGIVIAVLTALFSIVCSNYLVPKANFEFQSRFERIKRAKATMTIEEGIFNKDFKGYSIRVGKKETDGRSIKDIYIADQTSNVKTMINVIVAKEGEMYASADGSFFIMNLFDGEQYKDIKEKGTKKKSDKAYPFVRTKFKEWTKVFDMSEFGLNENLYELNKNRYDLLNSFQLKKGVDSLDVMISERVNTNHVLAHGTLKKTKNNYVRRNKDVNNKKMTAVSKDKKPTKSSANKKKSSLKNKNKKTTRNKKIEYKQTEDFEPSELSSFIWSIDDKVQKAIVNAAKNRASVLKDRAASSNYRVRSLLKEKDRFNYKLYEPYSWALVCIIFLFIGAPLGSIVRKGGYGYPLLFSILFYMVFMIMVIVGQKLVRNQSINAILAAWLPCLVLIPICLFLTVKALNDSKLLELNILNRFRVKKETEN